jgi:NADH-quinone oxidoreductase subunit N
MLSLAGIPPTAGFLGKYYIFLALIESGHYLLAVAGALYVAVAAYYYFRIVRAVFLTESAEPPTFHLSRGVQLALVACGVFTILIFVFPEPILTLAGDSVFAALR